MTKNSSIALKYTISTLLTLLSITCAHSQTLVPKLSQEGRKGDLARQANERAAERFDDIDGNKDGKLSPEELEEKAPYLAGKFAERDKNHDGYLTWEEFIGHDRWPR